MKGQTAIPLPSLDEIAADLHGLPDVDLRRLRVLALRVAQACDLAEVQRRLSRAVTPTGQSRRAPLAPDGTRPPPDGAPLAAARRRLAALDAARRRLTPRHGLENFWRG